MEIELIKANDFSEGSARKRVARLRVAAYCRVSTDDEDQIKSYRQNQECVVIIRLTKGEVMKIQ